jgi:hypothetical protein
MTRSHIVPWATSNKALSACFLAIALANGIAVDAPVVLGRQNVP